MTNLKNQRSPPWTVTLYALCANAQPEPHRIVVMTADLYERLLAR